MKYLSILFFLFSISLYSQDKPSNSENIKMDGITYQKDTNTVDPHYVLKCNMKINEVAGVKTISVAFTDKKDRQIGEASNYTIKKHSSGFYFLESRSGKKITVMNDHVVFVQRVKDSEHENFRRVKISYLLNNGDTKNLICHIP